MPHINAFITTKLNKEDEQKLVSRLGELIAIIPGKTEKGLMVSINSDSPLYHGGVAREKAAYFEVKIFKDCSREIKKELAAEMIKMLEQDFLIPKEHIYINFFEVYNWAAGGKLMDV
jgi:phenylpyruvate tautomerase PptA (4-oxalocrotonate tautomerase family)